MHTRMQGLETLKQREEQVKSQQSKGERQKPEEEESRLAEEVEGTYRQKVGRKVIQQSTPQSKPSALDTFNSIKKKFEGWCADVAEQHKTHSLGRHSRRKQLPSLPRTVSTPSLVPGFDDTLGFWKSKSQLDLRYKEERR